MKKKKLSILFFALAVPLGLMAQTELLNNGIGGTKADYGAAEYGDYFAQIVETAGSDTDYSLIDNTIYLERHEGVAGGQVTLSVRMKNTADIAGYQFNLLLPEGVSVAANSDGLLMAELSQERTTKQKTNSFSASILPGGTLQVLCGTMVRNPATGKLYTFEGNDGEVARITLNISEELATGDYPIYLKNVTVSTPDLRQFETSSLKSTLTVKNFIPGDVNGDGDIDINDVMALVSHICGQTPTQFDYTAADANADGDIDINDVMRVVDTIVNQ